MTQAQIIEENAELQTGDIAVLEVTLSNVGDAEAKEARPYAVITLGDMIAEHPAYSGKPSYPTHLQSVSDVHPSGTLVITEPWAA